MAEQIELRDAASGQPLYLNPAEVALVKDEESGGTRVQTDDGTRFVVEGRSVDILRRIQAALNSCRRPTDQQ